MFVTSTCVCHSWLSSRRFQNLPTSVRAKQFKARLGFIGTIEKSPAWKDLAALKKHWQFARHCPSHCRGIITARNCMHRSWLVPDNSRQHMRGFGKSLRGLNEVSPKRNRYGVPLPNFIASRRTGLVCWNGRQTGSQRILNQDRIRRHTRSISRR